MSTVLVVEDDDAIRNNVVRLLKLEGHEPVAAADGLDGLERARALRPDLVISDIGMPRMDGFALLQALRADPALAATPVMLLTALDDRASMRRGMTAGADDYLAKPFTRTELLEALAGLLKKRERLAGPAPAGPAADQVLQATVLFADIRGFTALAARLGSNEVAELLTHYFERCCEPVLRNGGQHLKFIGDGLMALFVQGEDGPAARRALSAALGITLAAHEVRGWVDQRFAGRGLPPLAIGVGLHAGEVTLCRVGPPGSSEVAALGDTVNVAARLETASKELGWTVVASAAALQAAGEGVRTGGMTALEVRGKNGFVDVAEIVGLDAGAAEAQHPGMATLAQRAGELAAALQVNSQITARAVKGAPVRPADAGGQGPAVALPLRGYRLTRKIGAGGMTEVYLAEREQDGLPVVLKVLDAGGQRTGHQLSRFIQEYAVLSRIQHPNVVRIHDQGFADDCAYIAMEYFPRGDLRGELKAGMERPRVLQVVAQVAQALAAIHALGVIHRDLKPENIMRRDDDCVALADFGIAKSALLARELDLTQTLHGDVVGTPYYMSPEQASGQPITAATDLYSLGIMFYEMLAGERPFRGETLALLLTSHLTAPTPALPPEHADLQPVLERLTAKSPQQRYASAAELLAELQERQLLRTVQLPRP